MNESLIAPAPRLALLFPCAAITLTLSLSIWTGAGLSVTSRWLLLYAALATLAVRLISSPRTSLPPLIPGLAAIAFLAYCFIAAFNPHGTWDPVSKHWTALSSAITILPSSADAPLAREQLPVIGAAIALLIAASTTFADALTRAALFAGLGLLGLSVAAYILLQRADIAPNLIDTNPLAPNDRHGGLLGPFTYHAHAAAFLAITLPLACQTVARRVPWAVPVVAAAFTGTAYLTGSRIGFATTLAAAVACCCLYLLPAKITLRPRLLIGLALIGLTPVVGVMAMLYARRDVAVLGRAVGSGRIQVWEITLKAIANAPFFGHGPGSFKLLLPVMAPDNREVYPRWIVTPPMPKADLSQWGVSCNDYLQALAEFGILGTALVAVIVTIALFRAWNATATPSHSNQSTAGAALLISLAAVAANAFLDWPLFLPGLLALTCTLVGACLCLRDQSSRTLSL